MQRELQLAGRVIRFSVTAVVHTRRWITRVLVRLIGTYVLLSRDTLQCPGCHAEVPLNGWFFCEWCQGKWLGHAFAPCPTAGCGAVPTWIPCPRCEHVVNNPAFYGG